MVRCILILKPIIHFFLRMICKSGYCPMAKRITKTNSRYLCKSVKEKIRKNLALFALSKSYNDILDVD